MFRSNHLLMLILALMVSLPASGQEPIPTQRQLNQYGLEVLWVSQAVLHQDRDRVMHVEIDEESVYIQSQNGFISAFDSQSGARRWAQLVGRINTPQMPLTSNSDTVLITSGINLYALDKWEGSELWHIGLDEVAGAKPVADEERVYIATQHGSVYAYDLAKIYELYHAGRLPKWSIQTQLWRHKTSRPIEIPPVRYGDQLTFASTTGIMYSVRPETDTLVFQMATDEPVSAPMIQWEDYLYTAMENNHVYCFDRGIGTTVWDFIAQSKVLEQPRIVQERCYISPSAGRLYCLDARTGVEYWVEREATKFVAKLDHYVVSEDRLGNLLLLSPDEDLGRVNVSGRLPLNGYKFKVSNELTDRVYMVTAGGQIVCLREQNKTFSKFFRNPDRRPIIPYFTDENAGTSSDDDQ